MDEAKKGGMTLVSIRVLHQRFRLGEARTGQAVGHETLLAKQTDAPDQSVSG
jgi:hypothetical protein